MDSRTAAPTPRSSRGTASMAWLAGWILVIGAISQLPYRNVWLHRSAFNYDAFTSFGPWYMALLGDVTAGERLFHVLQERFPGQVQPAYLFSNFARQLAIPFLPNTLFGHSYLQAIHSLGTVLAVAGLFRSFAVPVRYGVLGGLAFAMSGVNVSASQHTATHEALLYLVLSLLALRLYITRYSRVSFDARLALFAATALALVSLVRWYHQAVLYVLPVLFWTAGHVWMARSGAPWRAAIPLLRDLALLAVAVVVCSVPMLLTAYELSHVNKSFVPSYADLPSYFPEWPLFWLGLLLPHSTGAAFPVIPGPFAVGTDPTLGYLFAGSFTLPLAALYLRHLLLEKRYTSAVSIALVGWLLLGFAFGGGSPVHWLLCHVFPPLAMIGHAYFALHLFYLLSAFCLVQGLRVAVEGNALGTAAACAGLALLVLASLYFLAIPSYGYRSFAGSRAAFARAAAQDAVWSGSVLGVMLVILWLARRRQPRLAFVAVSLLIAVDFLRPVLDAHFVPNARLAAYLRSESHGFKIIRSALEYFASAKGVQPAFREIRVLPVGGWQANALFMIGVTQVSSSHDTQGNRYLEAALRAPPSERWLTWLAATYGIDFFWVLPEDRHQDGAKILSESPAFQKVHSHEWSGDIYRIGRNDASDLSWSSRSEASLGWFASPGIIRRHRGQIASHWDIDLADALEGAAPGEIRVSLPMMWLTQFEARSQGGDPLALSRDQNGRLQVALHQPAGRRLTVTYPSAFWRWGVLASVLTYLALVAVLVVALLLAGARYWRRARADAPAEV
jgi:hypothetical protein